LRDLTFRDEGSAQRAVEAGDTVLFNYEKLSMSLQKIWVKENFTSRMTTDILTLPKDYKYDNVFSFQRTVEDFLREKDLAVKAEL